MNLVSRLPLWERVGAGLTPVHAVFRAAVYPYFCPSYVGSSVTSDAGLGWSAPAPLSH